MSERYGILGTGTFIVKSSRQNLDSLVWLRRLALIALLDTIIIWVLVFNNGTHGTFMLWYNLLIYSSIDEMCDKLYI